eukprot:CAMPEP_0205819948 /NCGR_PEP_ID=MMETSP0206-20130828/2483_1 /ASSEMBLY_ACC=CAM_ASM_000279 /TAXON_ID=36767 /ORGANISM="Euplotes focardii, Strain TN1" /LENGTH=578 /DNA_ID=CAMNT_0053114125 /DNA_START=243 /DNA_END=1978 /DNA_ORIENTATION=-
MRMLKKKKMKKVTNYKKKKKIKKIKSGSENSDTLKNVVNLEKEEIPTDDAVNYILEIDEEKQKKSKSDVSVIFCLDVSGSMCVTTPVDGKMKIKGDRLNEIQDLMKFSDGSDQFFKEKKNLTYISRLQCVQAAIESQIMNMAEKEPEKKVGLVSFSNDVNIHGDCDVAPQVVSGDKLNDFEFIKKNGIDATDTHLQKAVGNVNKKLTDKLYELQESGPTALGPALLTSIAMATQGSAGSNVVLCTDGLSNVGLGAMETKEQKDLAGDFYDQVADFAHECGITVNIISIAGEECDLETLRTIPERTGGEIQRVEAAKLTENFANILSAPIIATDVKMKVIIHKGMEFKNEEEELLNNEKNVLTKDMGNVTADSEVTFEYKVKDITELEKAKEFDIAKITSLPFQTQIEFTKLDGMKCIRVVTKVQEITNDRKEVEAAVDAEILGTNAIQQTAKLARRGSFRKAQAYMKGQRRHWGNNVNNEEAGKEVRSHLHKVQNMYGMLQKQNDKEELYESDSECDDEKDDLMMSSSLFAESAAKSKSGSKSKSKKSKNTKKYKSKLDDNMVSEMSNMSKFNKNRKK